MYDELMMCGGGTTSSPITDEFVPIAGRDSMEKKTRPAFRFTTLIGGCCSGPEISWMCSVPRWIFKSEMPRPSLVGEFPRLVDSRERRKRGRPSLIALRLRIRRRELGVRPLLNSPLASCHHITLKSVTRVAKC